MALRPKHLYRLAMFLLTDDGFPIVNKVDTLFGVVGLVELLKEILVDIPLYHKEQILQQTIR